jgi:hypothetical protein
MSDPFEVASVFVPRIEEFLSMDFQGTVIKAAIAPKLRTRDVRAAELDLEKSATNWSRTP